MLKQLIVAGSLLAITAPALAQGRPDARALDCSSVWALIEQEGAVVLTTGQHTYDRYVASRNFCPVPYEPVPISIRTSDTDNCVVYRCGEPLFDDDF